MAIKENGETMTQFETDRQIIKDKLADWTKNLEEKFEVTLTEDSVKIKNILIDFSASGESSQAMKDRKYKLLEEGIELYYVYPWDVKNIDSMISHFNSKLGLDEIKLSARRLKVEKIDNTLANAFAKENHIQKSANGPGKISYALRDKKTGEIMAVQQYCKSRWSLKAGDPGVWEGLRLVIKNGVQIHGAATRLQKAFIKDENPNKLMSYVDFSHSLGNYKATQGFTLDELKGDSYMWVLMTDDPYDLMIIDKDGEERHPDLEKVLKTPYLNPNTVAGPFGKGCGVLLYGGRKLGSRKILKEKGNVEYHNDMFLEKIGYQRVYTAGQLRWSITLHDGE